MGDVSKQPRKQRKRWYNAPLHRRGKIMAVPLERSLREKYGIKRIPIRRGDTVLITSGDFKGIEGKVEKVDREKYRVYISNVTIKKANGEEVPFPIYYSKLLITDLDLSDKWRMKTIERAQKITE